MSSQPCWPALVTASGSSAFPGLLQTRFVHVYVVRLQSLLSLLSTVKRCSQTLMRRKHSLPIVVRLLFRCPRWLVPPPEGLRRHPGAVVAAQVRVVEEPEHEPDLWDAQAVDHHQLFVETRVKGLKVRSCRRSGDPEGPKALVTGRFDTNYLEAHSQEDVIYGKQLHLVEAKKKTKQNNAVERMKRNRRVGMSFGTVVDKRYWYLLLPLGVLKISSKSRVMSVMFLYRIDYLTSQSYSVRITCINIFTTIHS